MLHVVTVPGGTGVTIAIPFNDSDNAAAAVALLENLYQSAVNNRHIVDVSGGTQAAIPGEINELVDDTTGEIAVPTGYQYLIGDYKLQNTNPYPANSFIAGGTLDGSLIDSEPDSLQFRAGYGMVTVIAGGVFDMTTLSTGAGGGVVDLDGGDNEQAALTSGDWVLTTGTGSATITLGSGHDTIYADGADTIAGGSGTSTLILDGGHDVVNGGSGLQLISAGGDDDTIYAGSARTTVFGASPGTFIVGSGAEILFVDGTGGDTVIANNSGLVAYGAPGPGSVYQAPDSYFIYTNGGGSDTVNASSSARGPVVFGSAGGQVQLNSGAAGTFAVASGGGETIDAANSTAGITFFAGTGSSDLIGPNNQINFYGANTGNATLSGGIGNVYEFSDGSAGGTDLITHFGAYDGLYLYGYGTSANSGIAADIVQNGTLDLTLTDGTLIIFQNISSFAQIEGQIHHG